jgi:hypothetical protein
MKKEKNFQKRFVKEAERLDLQSIELSNLMNPDGKPDLLLLHPNNYLYIEIKISEHKQDFMIKSLFTGRPLQLPYYYAFLKSHEWRIYVLIKMNRGFEVLKLNRKMVKAIMAGLKYKELSTDWFMNSNFFTNKEELFCYLKGELVK